MRIRGRIVTETGEPVARARVCLLNGDIELIGGSSGQDGSFNMVREDDLTGRLRLRVTKEGFHTYDRELSAAGGDEPLSVTLTRGSQPDPGNTGPQAPMIFRGTVMEGNHAPIEGAKLQILAGGTEIAGLTSAADGSFGFADSSVSDTGDWTVKVRKAGFQPLERPIHTGEGNSLVLTRVKSTWRWKDPRVLAGAAVLVLLMILVPIVKHFMNSDSHSGQKKNGTNDQTANITSPLREVQINVSIKSKLIDTNLVLASTGPVFRVTVWLNEGKGEGEPQVFTNANPELNPVPIEVPETYARLLSVTTQINDQKLIRHVFMDEKDARAQDAADHVYNGILNMGRIGASMAALQKTNDPILKGYAARFFPDKSKAYLDQLQSLMETGITPEMVEAVLRKYTPNGPYSPDDLDVQKAMLPVLQNHLTEFKATRHAPVGFTNAIYDAYQKVTNSVSELLKREEAKDKKP